MSGLDLEELPDPKGPADRFFRHAVTVGAVLLIVGLPVGAWVAKQYFGWQPPPFVVKLMAFLDQ